MMKGSVIASFCTTAPTPPGCYSSPPSSLSFSLVSGVSSSSPLPLESFRLRRFLHPVSNRHNSFTAVSQKTNTSSRWVSFSRLLAPLPIRSLLILNCWFSVSLRTVRLSTLDLFVIRTLVGPSATLVNVHSSSISGVLILYAIECQTDDSYSSSATRTCYCPSSS